MSDGFVILLIGMGVVFLFLLVLMAFIRIVSASRKDGDGNDKVVGEGSPEAVQAKQKSVSSAEPDEQIATVAAVAVALELANRRTSVRVDSGRQPSNSWSQSGRQALFRGPQAVSQALMAHRGRK